MIRPFAPTNPMACTKSKVTVVPTTDAPTEKLLYIHVPVLGLDDSFSITDDVLSWPGYQLNGKLSVAPPPLPGIYYTTVYFIFQIFAMLEASNLTSFSVYLQLQEYRTGAMAIFTIVRLGHTHGRLHKSKTSTLLGFCRQQETEVNHALLILVRHRMEKHRTDGDSMGWRLSQDNGERRVESVDWPLCQSLKD